MFHHIFQLYCSAQSYWAKDIKPLENSKVYHGYDAYCLGVRINMQGCYTTLCAAASRSTPCPEGQMFNNVTMSCETSGEFVDGLLEYTCCTFSFYKIS